jgi:hypothetical protein
METGNFPGIGKSRGNFSGPRKADLCPLTSDLCFFQGLEIEQRRREDRKLKVTTEHTDHTEKKLHRSQRRERSNLLLWAGLSSPAKKKQKKATDDTEKEKIHPQISPLTPISNL